MLTGQIREVLFSISESWHQWPFFLEPPRSIRRMNHLLFRVELRVGRHGSFDLGASRCQRDGSKKRIQEAAPRGISKRCIHEASPRGGSERRLQEECFKREPDFPVCAAHRAPGDVQEATASSKRRLQEAAPRGSSERQPATSKRQLETPRGGPKKWLQESAPKGAAVKPMPKANTN